MDGWFEGHLLRRGHEDFPGDPLPGGHLGKPRDLAFWDALSHEDDEDTPDTGESGGHPPISNPPPTPSRPSSGPLPPQSSTSRTPSLFDARFSDFEGRLGGFCSTYLSSLWASRSDGTVWGTLREWLGHFALTPWSLMDEQWVSRDEVIPAPINEPTPTILAQEQDPALVEILGRTGFAVLSGMCITKQGGGLALELPDGRRLDIDNFAEYWFEVPFLVEFALPGMWEQGKALPLIVCGVVCDADDRVHIEDAWAARVDEPLSGFWPYKDLVEPLAFGAMIASLTCPDKVWTDDRRDGRFLDGPRLRDALLRAALPRNNSDLRSWKDLALAGYSMVGPEEPPLPASGRPEQQGAPLPSKRLLKSARDAEMFAAEVINAIGFTRVQVCDPGPDAGVDVRAEGVVAQVKMEAVKTTRPTLQRLTGIAAIEGAQAVFFSLAGYTADASAWAEQTGMALFEFDYGGGVTARSRVALALLRRFG